MELNGLMRVELLVPFTAEIDEDSYAEWLGLDQPDSEETRSEFIRSSPDWWTDASLEDPGWHHEVTDYDIYSIEMDDQ